MKCLPMFIGVLLAAVCFFSADVSAVAQKSAGWKGLIPWKFLPGFLRQKFESSNEVIGNNTLLNELSTELILKVLDDLDFYELLEVAQVNEKLNILASHVFRQRFSEIVIMQRFLYNPESYAEFFWGVMADDFEPDDIPWVVTGKKGETLHLYEFELTLKTLKYFGRAMIYLRLHYADHFHNGYLMDEVTKYVNDYCYESLNKITIDGSRENSITNLTNPFTNVKEAYLIWGLPEYRDGLLELNQLFPSLAYLSVRNYHDESNCFECHFPQLEHVSLDIKTIDDKQSAIDDLLKENPQIWNVSMYQTSPKLLKMVNARLPNLQHLSLMLFDMNNDTIHFENVEMFALQWPSSSPRNLHFTKLSEFHMKCSGTEHFGDWVSFVQENPTITTFKMIYSNLYDEQFEQIAKHLANVQEMSFDMDEFSSRSVGINAVIQFIENHTKLNKFDMNRCSDADTQTIHQRLGGKWNINTNGNGLCLQRRNHSNI